MEDIDDDQTVSQLSREILLEKHDDIRDRLKQFCKSYSPSTIRGMLETPQTNINDKKFLTDLSKDEPDDTVGATLYAELENLFSKAVGHAIYPDIIKYNFDVEVEKSNVLSERSELEEKRKTITAIVEEVHIAPSENMLNLRIISKKREVKKSYKPTKRMTLRSKSPDTKSSESEEIEKTTTDPVTKSSETTTKEPVSKSSEEIVKDPVLEQLLEDAEADLVNEFVFEFNQYQKAIATQNQKRSENTSIKENINSLLVYEQHLQSLITFGESLCTTIKNSLESYPTVKGVLNGSILLPGCEIPIASPMDSNHIQGIFGNLYKHYREMRFTGLSLTLIDTLRFDFNQYSGNFDYNKVLKDLDKIKTTWVKRGLFAELSEDLLFTCLLIKGLPPKSVIRREITLSVEKKITSLSKKSKEFQTDYHRKDSLYQSCREELKTSLSANKFNDSDLIKRDKPLNKNQTSTTKGKELPRVTNIERAALSEENSGKKFSGEVSRAQGVTFTDSKGRRITYMAHLLQESICSKCFHPDPTQRQKCTPRECYKGKCTRCLYYGHNNSHCMQSHHRDGSVLSD